MRAFDIIHVVWLLALRCREAHLILKIYIFDDFELFVSSVAMYNCSLT